MLTLGGIIIEPPGGKNGMGGIIGICGGNDIIVYSLIAIVIIPIKNTHILERKKTNLLFFSLDVKTIDLFFLCLFFL